MKGLNVKQTGRTKMKFKISIVLLGFFCISLFSQTRSYAQEDLADIADFAISIFKAIDSSCDANRPDGGFMACKGGTCAPAKCISFRTRCEDGQCKSTTN